MPSPLEVPPAPPETPTFDSIGLSARLVKSYGEEAAQQALLELWERGRVHPEQWEKPTYELERLARAIAHRRASNERRNARWYVSLEGLTENMGEDESETPELAEQGRDASPEALLLAQEAHGEVQRTRRWREGVLWLREEYGAALRACH